MRSKDFLRRYASQFQTVEIDSTFYGTPAVSTVTSWNERTPQDFIFAVKVPQVITHEKVLVDCEPEFEEFVERMHLLGDKLGPMLLQFPKFDRCVLKSPDEFRGRLQFFFKRAADVKAGRFAAEVRNKDWLDAPGRGTIYTDPNNPANSGPIDSMTLVKNFTSSICSAAVSTNRWSVDWYVKIIVKPGAFLDFSNSAAGFGTAP